MPGHTFSRPLLWAIAMTCVLAGAASADPVAPQGAPVPAPAGFLRFCLAEPAECSSQPPRLVRSLAAAALVSSPGPATAAIGGGETAAATPPPILPDWAAVFGRPAPAYRPLALTPALRTLMSHSNAQVNRALRSRLDQGSDTWSLPLRDRLGAGDCEDYVLEKRRLLIAAGVPSEALSIAVVAPPQGPIHAVLLVATDQGELVLDNLNPRILRWDRTGYRFIQRQVPGMPLRWVKVAAAG